MVRRVRDDVRGVARRAGSLGWCVVPVLVAGGDALLLDLRNRRGAAAEQPLLCGEGEGAAGRDAGDRDGVPAGAVSRLFGAGHPLLEDLDDD